MSRSRRKAIIKDKPKSFKRTPNYWRRIRSTIKNVIRSCKNLEDLEIPNPKTIVNDYDYCDYIFKYEYDTTWGVNYSYEELLEDRKKLRRK